MCTSGTWSVSLLALSLTLFSLKCQHSKQIRRGILSSYFLLCLSDRLRFFSSHLYLGQRVKGAQNKHETENWAKVAINFMCVEKEALTRPRKMLSKAEFVLFVCIFKARVLDFFHVAMATVRITCMPVAHYFSKPSLFCLSFKEYISPSQKPVEAGRVICRKMR